MVYRIFLTSIAALCLVSCGPISSNPSSGDFETLLEIYNSAHTSNLSFSDANAYDELSDRLRYNQIDEMEISYQANEYSGLDSTVTFTKYGGNLFQSTERIVYDFASIPQNVGSEKLQLASYERTQINERWYYETIGFD